MSRPAVPKANSTAVHSAKVNSVNLHGLKGKRMDKEYSANAPTRSEVDALAGPAVVEFGTSWCGHCQAAQSAIRLAFEGHAGVQHLKIEDGSGRVLGRSYGVKLWPTLVFLRDGKELARVVRPRETPAISAALALIDPAEA